MARLQLAAHQSGVAQVRMRIAELPKNIDSECVSQREVVGFGAVKNLVLKLAVAAERAKLMGNEVGEAKVERDALKEITARLAMILDSRNGDGKVSVISNFLQARHYGITTSLFMVKGFQRIATSEDGTANILGVVRFLSNPKFDEAVRFVYAVRIFDACRSETNMDVILEKAAMVDNAKWLPGRKMALKLVSTPPTRRDYELVESIELRKYTMDTYSDPFEERRSAGSSKNHRLYRSVMELQNLSRIARVEFAKLLHAINEEEYPASVIANLGDKLMPIRTNWATEDELVIGNVLRIASKPEQ